ncbi:LOW QUALITY PROTEIN: histone-binding protein N1/N2-like [Bombina bombina]|uniref:LOW QUALITY PROTEIN: histone-binding protein N1/N2-like n=1 Tax=Bombina bombina TaxID=8345 RepID=UPI00235A62D7|nr:LOW QUALITY PROTEIN: histone-binding protein N1/N2-like [Bombina bombina]
MADKTVTDAIIPKKPERMEETAAQSTSTEKSEEVDVDAEAKQLLGAGHRHLVMKDIRAAVNAFQEASGLLAKKHGETADECAEAFFAYGISLLELAKMENVVLGNALEGMPEEEEEGEKEDPNIPSADNLDEKEREQLREQVYDAMAEDEAKPTNGHAEAESKPKEDVDMETKESNGDVPESEEKDAEMEEDKPEDSKTESNKPELSKTKNQPESSKDESKLEKSKDESKPEATKTESKPEASKDVSQLEESKDESKPEASKDESKPEESKNDSKPEAAKAESIKPEDSKTESKPESTKTESNKPEESAEAGKPVKTKTDEKADKLESEKQETEAVEQGEEKTKEVDAKVVVDSSEAKEENSVKESETKDGDSEAASKDLEPSKSEKQAEEKTNEDQEQMDAEEEEGSEEEAEGSEEKENEEDDVGNLQLAWEMLDLSKSIFQRQKTKEAQLKAAQAHLKLGEVSVESENYSQAVDDFLACLNIQKEHFEEHDRLLAETHYQLGLAYQYSSKHEEAISHFNQSVEVIEKRMAVLTEQKNKAGEEPTADIQKEMDELKGLLPDIKEKIEDSKEAQKTAKTTEIALKETLAGSSGFSQENGSTSSAISVEKENTVPATNCVSDISHLVRKKRKPEEESPLKDSEAKKPKPELVENGAGSGDAVVPTNEEAEKAEEADKQTPMETGAVESTA